MNHHSVVYRPADLPAKAEPERRRARVEDVNTVGFIDARMNIVQDFSKAITNH